MNHANLHDNHGMRMGTVVVTIALAIILFEVAPEKSAWSIPVKEADEHIIAVQASGGFSLLLTQKQGEEHKALTKEQDYEKQYHYRKRILIVDDDTDVCFVLEKVLGEKGYMVDSNENPTLALENFNAHSYDLVILDIKMPDLDGFALYREIKRLDKKVKLCFLTAGETYYGLYSDIFPSLPANCFILKPIENEELMKRIDEIISNDTTT